MYKKELIIKTMRSIYEESKDIKPYVVVAMPRRNKEETPAQNFDGYEGLHIDFNGFSHGYCDISGEKVDVARNYLIEQVLHSGAKYMFFIGEDTVLPYDAFTILHKTAEENSDAIVTGVYYIKLSSPMIMIKKDDYVIPANVDPGQIFEAWQTGLDCALIPVKILQDIKDKNPELPFCCIGHNIPGLPFIGEDNFLTFLLRREGYKTLVNTDVQCLHCDLKTGQYTAHPDVKLENYFSNIEITTPFTIQDKQYIDTRWTERIPK